MQSEGRFAALLMGQRAFRKGHLGDVLEDRPDILSEGSPFLQSRGERDEVGTVLFGVIAVGERRG